MKTCPWLPSAGLAAQRMRTTALTGAALLALGAAAAPADAADVAITGPWVTKNAAETYGITTASADLRTSCRVNGGAWVACAPPSFVASGFLANQNNSVRVRIETDAGPLAPVTKWTFFDTRAPVVAGTATRDASTNTTTVTATGTDNHVLRSLRLELDGRLITTKDTGYAATSSITRTFTAAEIDGGPHVVTVTATDAAGISTATRIDVAPQRLFAPDSFWNRALAGDAPLDARSDLLSTSLRAAVDADIAANRGPWINTTQYSTPLYTVPAAQPLVPVKLDGSDAMLAAVLADGVPIPDNARAAAGGDQHLTIYQPATDQLWDFWLASRQADGWHVGWGGVMHKVATGPGLFTDRLDTLTNRWVERYWWGSSASGLPVIGGTITLAEGRAGVVPHVLALALPNTCKVGRVWPATRNDGLDASATCIPEGTRFRIDPSVDLSAIAMPRFTRMLATAAQRYGVVVRDSSPVVTFYAEDPTQYGANLWATENLMGGAPQDLLRQQFPWGLMQVVAPTP